MDDEPVIECVCDFACELGENPIWHALEGKLYWEDIARGHLYRYDPATGVAERFYEGARVGGFTIQEDGSLLLFMEQGAVKIYKDGVLTEVLKKIPGEEDSRFNDVIADPQGRVFCGTMATGAHPGSLYRLDPDRTLRKVVEGVGVSNGLGFSPDRKYLYYTDSPKLVIYRFDYDQETGEISNRQVFIRHPDNFGVPDGMTVDAEGYIWSAVWDGGCLIRYDPRGKEATRIGFPARKVTSVTFGGPDYEDVYVTTAGGNDKENQGTGAGAIFHFQAGVRGLPEFHSRI